MRESVTFTRVQDRRAGLAAHYELVQEVIGPKFPDSRFVPGEGDPMAKVVFIGEAPGAQEDKAGRPFV
jgi:uracil-DNA glycosylase